LIRFTALTWLLLVASSALAQQELSLDPESTRVTFQFEATLHRVDGRLDVSRGSLRFDPEAGSAEGQIVLDARSATTDNRSRDRKMHEQVLESERYGEVVFEAERLVVHERSTESARVTLAGNLLLHGASRPLAVPATLAFHGEAVEIVAEFEIDYTEWGVRNVGNFLMRVSDRVSVRVEASGRLASTPGASP